MQYIVYTINEKEKNYLHRAILKKLSEFDFIDIYPQEPNYFFVPKNFTNKNEYEKGFKIDEVFEVYNSGIQTKNDKLSITFSKEALERVYYDFINMNHSDIIKKYKLKDSAGWKIDNAINDIKCNLSDYSSASDINSFTISLSFLCEE